MTLGLTFATPWLLLGLLAAAIPVVLHLLSSVRAPEVFFPTLRFLRISMQKTARRRRLEHWLLLVIRSLLLAALALAVAEPIVRSATGFFAGRRFAAVVILDNSYSMGMRSGGGTRFQAAVDQAKKLLGGDSKPSMAAVLVTNRAAAAGQELMADLGEVRKPLEAPRLASGRAPIPERVAQAVGLLKDHSAGQRAIYIFSDLQRISFEGLSALTELKGCGIPLMVVNCAGEVGVNVGISDLRIGGRRIVDQAMPISATLINSSPTDRTVNVRLHVDGRQRGEAVRVTLGKARGPGAKAAVRFADLRFARPGVHYGHVAIEQADDLATDNVRRFSLDVADRVAALLVRGDDRMGGGGELDPAEKLQVALAPYLQGELPWSIRLRTISAGQFTPADLAGVQVVFLADVRAPTAEQAGALVDFVRRGGTAVFFLGPSIDPARYNDLLVAGVGLAGEQARAVSAYGGLLPGRIGKAVGEVGVEAPALEAAGNLRHAYLADLFETPADYPDVLVQRYYRIAPAPAGVEMILATPAPDTWGIALARPFGAGRCVLFATTASTEWNNLPTAGGGGTIFLPIVARICLEAGGKLGADHTYAEGAAVTIRPRGDLAPNAVVNVFTPDGQAEKPLALAPAAGGPAATFTNTRQLGVYHWRVAGAPAEAEGAGGTFVTNPSGVESDLAAMNPATLAANVKKDLNADVYVGNSLAGVHAAAADAAAGDHWWDRLLALAILLLVVESVVANRLRRGAQPIPAHLNPRVAG